MTCSFGAKLICSIVLSADSESGKVDQEWVLEFDYEEERDVLVTWVLDLSKSPRRRESKLPGPLTLR
jgi:hypothetical protein